jgi:hypothetical protein
MGRVDVERTKPAKSAHVLGYGGTDWLLPPTLPVSALEAILGEGTGEQLLAFFQAVLGEPGDGEVHDPEVHQWRAFAKVLNIADLPDLGAAIGQIYGTSLGEARASGPSSGNGSGS